MAKSKKTIVKTEEQVRIETLKSAVAALNALAKKYEDLLKNLRYEFELELVTKEDFEKGREVFAGIINGIYHSVEVTESLLHPIVMSAAHGIVELSCGLMVTGSVISLTVLTQGRLQPKKTVWSISISVISIIRIITTNA